MSGGKVAVVAHDFNTFLHLPYTNCGNTSSPLHGVQAGRIVPGGVIIDPWNTISKLQAFLFLALGLRPAHDQCLLWLVR